MIKTSTTEARKQRIRKERGKKRYWVSCAECSKQYFTTQSKNDEKSHRKQDIFRNILLAGLVECALLNPKVEQVIEALNDWLLNYY